MSGSSVACEVALSEATLGSVSGPSVIIETFQKFPFTTLNLGREIKLIISAENENGKSSPVVLDVFTTKVAQLQVGMLQT